MEDVFWGWNNEVHIFNPAEAGWSEPKTHVRLILVLFDITIYNYNVIAIVFYRAGYCVQGRAPAPRAAHASATLGHRGYICGGRVMVRAHQTLTLLIFTFIFNKSVITVQNLCRKMFVSCCFVQETRTSDIHCLDLETWTWSEMCVTLSVRLFHVASQRSSTYSCCQCINVFSYGYYSHIECFAASRRRQLQSADPGIRSPQCRTTPCSCLEASVSTVNRWVGKLHLQVVLFSSALLSSPR